MASISELPSLAPGDFPEKRKKRPCLNGPPLTRAEIDETVLKPSNQGLEKAALALQLSWDQYWNEWRPQIRVLLRRMAGVVASQAGTRKEGARTETYATAGQQVQVYQESSAGGLLPGAIRKGLYAEFAQLHPTILLPVSTAVQTARC